MRHRAAVDLDGEQHAALHRLPVELHGARAAVAGVAADVRAGQVEVVAEEVHEQAARLDLALVARAVDVDRDVRLVTGCSARLRPLSRLGLAHGADGADLGEVAAVVGGGVDVGGRLEARPRAPPSRTAASSVDSGRSTTGTASTQPTASRGPPSRVERGGDVDDAGAVGAERHAPRSRRRAWPAAGTEIFVSSSPSPTAVM